MPYSCDQWNDGSVAGTNTHSPVPESKINFNSITDCGLCTESSVYCTVRRRNQRRPLINVVIKLLQVCASRFFTFLLLAAAAVAVVVVCFPSQNFIVHYDQTAFCPMTKPN